MKKAKIITAALALTLVAGVSLSATLAYFTDKDSVINTFSTKSDGTDDQNVAIEITENGWIIDAENGKATRQDNTNKKIYPGAVIDKAPIVTNTGLYDCYIRVAAPQLEDYQSVNFNTSDWELVDGYYYYKEIVAPGSATTALFNNVTFSKDTPEKLANLADIAIDAEAVQSEGIAEVEGEAQYITNFAAATANGDLD